MRSARFFTVFSVGLLAGLCGCYHYGYSPYGNPYGPGTYPTAPGGYPPTISPGSPAPYAPYNSPGPSPTPINPTNPPPEWRSNGSSPSGPLPGNPAIPYDPQPGDRRVPDPTDDTKSFGAPPGAGTVPATPLGAIPGSGVELQPIESSAYASPPSLAANVDPFEIPAKSVSSGNAMTARTPLGGSRPNPFAHDSRNFTWLRGIVDYDPQDQRWMMIYSANPNASDRYGGSITLSDHQLLNRIKPGDVVLVEGRVETNHVDQHGKPLYRIEKLEALRPKNQ